MQAILRKLMKTAGMVGAGVYDLTGALVASAGSLPQDPGLGRRVGAFFQRLADPTRATLEGAPLSLAVALRGGGHLFVDRVGTEERDLFLVVVAGAAANLALLNVNRTACRAEIEKHVQEEVEVSRPAPLPVAMRVSVGRGHPSLTGAVGPEAMAHFSLVYERYVGPLGKRLLEQDVLRMGTTPDELRFDQVADLLDILARRLPPERRATFTSEALGDTQGALI